MEEDDIHTQLRLIIFGDAKKAALKKGQDTVKEVWFRDLKKINPGEYGIFTPKQKKIICNKLQSIKRLTDGYQALEREYHEKKHSLAMWRTASCTCVKLAP